MGAHLADTIWAQDRFDEAQARCGVEPVDKLLHQREMLIASNSTMLARHASYGIFDGLRKARLSVAALRVRSDLQDRGERATDKAVEEKSHADPAYQQFLSDWVVEAAQALIVQDKIDAITERIRRGGLVMRAHASEPK